MNILEPELWQKIRPIFAAGFPREVIVAVHHDGSFHELDNVDPEPTKGFIIPEADWLDLMETPPRVLLHSHPTGVREVSDLDSRNQLACDYPWGIVTLRGNDRTLEISHIGEPECWGEGVAIPPLVGRTYFWGIRDCYSLVRDYYRLQGHDFPNPPRCRRPGIDAPSHLVNQIQYQLEQLGFTRVLQNQRQPGDVFTQYWGTRGSNVHDHCGVYLGSSQYLHQLSDRTSEVWIPHDERQVILESKLQTQFWRAPLKYREQSKGDQDA